MVSNPCSPLASLGCCFMSVMGVIVPFVLSVLIKNEYEFIELAEPEGGFCGMPGAKPPPDCMEKQDFIDAAASTSLTTAMFYGVTGVLSGVFAFGHWMRGAYRM